MPKDQTSDLMVKRPYRAASGAVHLMGNLAPVFGGEERRGEVTGHPTRGHMCSFLFLNAHNYSGNCDPQ